MEVVPGLLLICGTLFLVNSGVKCKGLREEFTWTRISYALPMNGNETEADHLENQNVTSGNNNYIYGEDNYVFLRFV